MARKLRCKNCGATAEVEDAGSNWSVLGQRNGRPMFACNCGHGLYVGLFTTSHATPTEVEDQKLQMRKAGIDPDRKLPTGGDIRKVMREAPPGDTAFEVGNRIIDPMGSRGTVKEVLKEGDKMMLKVLFDEGYGDIVVGVDPVIGKIRKIQS